MLIILEFHQAVNNGNILFSCVFESLLVVCLEKMKIIKSDYFNLLANRMKKQMKICRHDKGIFSEVKLEKRLSTAVQRCCGETAVGWWEFVPWFVDKGQLTPLCSVPFPLERKTKECNNNKSSTKRGKCWYLLNIIFVFAAVQILHWAGLNRLPINDVPLPAWHTL